jgi:tetratricopeptide (TPR) repeat protein
VTLARLLLPFLVGLALAACGGSQPAPPPKPSDPGLDSGLRLARFALRSGEYEQAVMLYERALQRAYARDDARAISDIGYEYPLALLRNGKAEASLAQARETRAELARRHTPPLAEHFLIEAVAAYELGDAARARDASREALARIGPDDGQAAARAHYILGMIAADERDVAGVDAAITAAGSPASEATKADAAELRGRRALLANDGSSALNAFLEAASIRRELRDYPGMAQALASAGTAAEAAANPAAAADYFYRAGLSAAVQKNRKKAEPWLTKARDLAARNGLTAIEADAQSRLQSLKE